MVRDRDPFNLALSRLRESLRDGQIEPGQPLLAAELAAGLKVSVTPVREALSRLAGEGLVEGRRGRGFYVPRPGAAEIEEAYSLHRAYVELAVDIGGDAKVEMMFDFTRPLDGHSFRAQTEHVWSRVIQRASDGALARAHAGLADQLALIRLFEPMVLQDLGAELEAVVEAARRSDAAFKDVNRDYHSRRQTAARSLGAKFRDSTFPLNYIINII